MSPNSDTAAELKAACMNVLRMQTFHPSILSTPRCSCTSANTVHTSVP